MFNSTTTHQSKLQDLHLMITSTLHRAFKTIATFFNLVIVLGSLMLLPSQGVLAEQKESFGDYEVHYSAFASTFLSPDVAKQYDIVRSRAVGVINISILKKTATGTYEPVAAQVDGVMTNDIQQKKHLGFRRIKEGKAIYFITEVQFMEGEVLAFNISATPEGQQQPLQLRFSQTFYNEKR